MVSAAPTRPPDQKDNSRLRPYDVLTALKLLAASWPTVIVPEKGKRSFRRSKARAVLMELHRCYHWETFAIAIPIEWTNRARPAEDVDIARETDVGRTTVGAVMRWLTDEVKILVTVKGHGWTGATVRRFNVELINQLLGRSEPERTVAVPSHIEGRPEPERTVAGSEGTVAVHLEAHKQETVTEVRHGEQGASQREESITTPAREQSLAELMDPEAVEKVIHLVPSQHRKLLRPTDNCRWALEGNRLVVECTYGSHHRLLVRDVLTDLADAVDQVYHRKVELRLAHRTGK